VSFDFSDVTQTTNTETKKFTVQRSGNAAANACFACAGWTT
jgi:hypothetical protein